MIEIMQAKRATLSFEDWCSFFYDELDEIYNTSGAVYEREMEEWLDTFYYDGVW